MYNRYIPTTDGAYRREILEEPPAESLVSEPSSDASVSAQSGGSRPAPQPFRGPLGMDLGDLLLLCVVVLLLLDSQEERSTILIAVAAYLLQL